MGNSLGESLVVEFERGESQILINGVATLVDFPIDGALSWPKKSLVVLLDMTGPTALHILDQEGREVMRLDPPEGFQFYYLQYDADGGVFAVCVTRKHQSGYNDWNFLIDLKVGSLRKMSPAK